MNLILTRAYHIFVSAYILHTANIIYINGNKKLWRKKNILSVSHAVSHSLCTMRIIPYFRDSFFTYTIHEYEKQWIIAELVELCDSSVFHLSLNVNYVCLWIGKNEASICQENSSKPMKPMLYANVPGLIRI